MFKLVISASWCSTGSILGQLLFLIYISDLPDSLESLVELFADDTSLLLTVYDPNMLADQLAKKISDWTYKWKLIFNPGLSKQKQEVMFSRETNKISHPTTTMNTVPVAHTSCQKHLGLYIDEKLNFSQNINIKISKANTRIGIIKRLSHIIPRKTLLTTYKSFIRPHLDYCDVIYDQPNYESSCTKIGTMLPLLLLVQ